MIVGNGGLCSNGQVEERNERVNERSKGVARIEALKKERKAYDGKSEMSVASRTVTIFP